MKLILITQTCMYKHSSKPEDKFLKICDFVYLSLNV